jgi:hypothetical protein
MISYITLTVKASSLKSLYKQIAKKLSDFGFKEITADIDRIELQENRTVKVRITIAPTKILDLIEETEETTQKQTNQKIRSYQVKVK